MAEGEKIVRRLVESPMEILSVVMPPRWVEDYRPLLAARRERIPVYVGELEVLDELTGFNLYQGVLALGRVPSIPTLPDLFGRSDRPSLLVAIDGVSSAENVGVLMRTAAAFGATGFLKGEASASPYLRRAVRGSMGAVLRLPVAELSNLRAALLWLREHGVLCVAAHPHAERRELTHIDLTRDVCVVLGSEGEGISPPVLEACSLSVAIPMAHEVDSLNVAMAGTAFLYEAARQRRAKG